MNSFTRTQRADNLLSQGRCADAWAELQKIPPEDDDIVEVVSMRVQTLTALRRYADAHPFAQRLVELNLDQTINWTWLGVTTRKTMGLEAAAAVYEKAVSMYPATGCLRYSLASRYCGLGRFEEAREHMALGLALDPSWKEVALDDPALSEIWDVVAQA
jgi:tetratricopeptide (TPR) repeat protein